MIIIYFRYVLFIVFLSLMIGCSPRTSEGTYKTWEYSDKNVIGINKLDNLNEKDYCNISRINDGSVKVEVYNEHGFLEETDIVGFQDGLISYITRTNKWSFTFKKEVFEKIKGNSYLVTTKNWGTNEDLPCKGKILKFEDGLLVEMTYTGFDNHICECKYNYSTIKFIRYSDKNRRGLIQEQSFFDETGNAAISSGYDCHTIKYERDDRGNIVTESYYGLNGESIKSRFGVHKINYKYEQDYNLTEIKYFWLSGEPVSNIYGTSKIVYEYNQGMISKMLRYNLKNEISEETESQGSDGAAIIKYKYDEHGNAIKFSYFDKSEKPIITNMGYHNIEVHFDKNDLQNEVIYQGLDRVPATDKRGIHKYYYLYDNLGRQTSLAYFDKFDNPMKDDVGLVYMEKNKYDDEGKLISVSYWKNENTKMTRWSGIHEYKHIYNEQGQREETIQLDTDGNHIKSTSGESRLVIEYDKLSRAVSYKNYAGDNPVLVTNPAQVSNYHKCTFEYDKQNRVSTVQYFDLDGKAINAIVNNSIQVQKIKFEYVGNIIVRQNWFRQDSNIPSKVIDCNTSECMSIFGNDMMYLNK